MDSEQRFEELAKKYPDLFEKAATDYFAIGPGWYNIIDILCGGIYRDVNMKRYQLQYAKDKNQIKKIEVLEQDLAQAIKDLPIIEQVKEKFGSLRFYYIGGNERISHYVEFAEAMSSITCEECGAPGVKRNDGWIKTLCDHHHEERKKRYNSIT